jgi:hypothetical protein
MMMPRVFWIALSIILSFAGARILLDTIRHPAHYADEYVLLGGTLSALGLVPIYVAFKQYQQRNPPSRRIRHRAHLSKEIETKL